MIKLSKLTKTIYYYLFFFVGLFFILNVYRQNVLALPGINLNIRKNQLEEEKNILLQQLTDTYNNTNLNSETRLNMMCQISARIDIVQNELQNINQQIINSNQYRRQRRNTNHNNSRSN
ncbi:MAG: effector protein ['Waltheria sp.' little leaf phytoplasma]|nr:effector protein ['Waltheria sp.' little leaf phytoplasma]